MRVLELYAGIGGMHYALETSGVPGEVVAAIEISTVANKVYCHNFPSTNLINRNIESLSIQELDKLNIDTIFMSPPCQPFTKNGLQKDEDDARTISFFHVLKLIPQLENLKYILLENVEPFSRSSSRQKLIEIVKKCGFHFNECVLSPVDFGVPNSRCRYFLIASKTGVLVNSTKILNANEILKILSQSKLYIELREKFPGFSPEKCPALDEFIEKEPEKNTTDLDLIKRLNVLDIRTADSRGSCCFTSAYGRYAEGTGSVFSSLALGQVQKILQDNSNKCPDSSNHLNLRYFTPREVSRLMCFPESFSFPNTINNRQKYKLLGNSVNIHVVSHLILLLHHAAMSKNCTSVNI